jgi:hypothetical protein
MIDALALQPELTEELSHDHDVIGTNKSRRSPSREPYNALCVLLNYQEGHVCLWPVTTMAWYSS